MSALRHEISDRELWYSLTPPLLSIKFLDNETLSNMERFSYEFFSALWGKNFERKIVIPPLQRVFSIPEVFRYTKLFQQFFPVLCDNNFSIQSRDIPLLGRKFFDTRNILKHRRAPLRNFSAVWDKKRQNRDTPIIQKKFDTITFLKYRGPPRKIFGSVGRKNYRRKNVIPHPPPVHKTFSIPKIFWNTEGFHYEVFRSCETKKVRQKIVTWPS